MGDAGRELAQTGHLFLLNELRLGGAQLDERALQLAGALLHLGFEGFVLGRQQGLLVPLLGNSLGRKFLPFPQLHLQQLRILGKLAGQEQRDGQRRRQKDEGDKRPLPEAIGGPR